MQKPTRILLGAIEARLRGNDAVEENGERARLGRCSARPRAELRTRETNHSVGYHAAMPTARAPMAAPEAGALPESV